MVSVIIPNYNCAKWLPSVIGSCLQQQSLNEIVIVDDHSSDESWSILKNFEKDYDIIKLFKNTGKGSNSARNYGYSKSTGNYIQWLDSDDYLLPGKFEAQIPALKNGSVDIIYSDWRMDYWVNGSLKNQEIKKYKQYPDFLNELLKDNWTSPNNYLMTRKFAEKLDGEIGWNTATKVGQDREYFTMAGILGARFKYVPGTFAVYNKQEKGTISGIGFKNRLEENQKLESRFRTEILKNDLIPDKRKKKYLAILDTHKLKACFYHPDIKLSHPISPLNVKIEMMHWKMALMMPYIYVKKHIQYFF